jgi:hypothetical protein
MRKTKLLFRKVGRMVIFPRLRNLNRREPAEVHNFSFSMCVTRDWDWLGKNNELIKTAFFVKERSKEIGCAAVAWNFSWVISDLFSFKIWAEAHQLSSKSSCLGLEYKYIIIYIYMWVWVWV